MIAVAALSALVATCAPHVALDTAHALIAVESGRNPFAIGVVGGALVRQPASLQEALATAAALDAAGWDYSVGLGQINKRNFARLKLTVAGAFEPCANLGAMQNVLAGCFARASQRRTAQAAQQAALRDALSCYYSGNFVTCSAASVRSASPSGPNSSSSASQHPKCRCCPTTTRPSRARWPRWPPSSLNCAGSAPCASRCHARGPTACMTAWASGAAAASWGGCLTWPMIGWVIC